MAFIIIWCGSIPWLVDGTRAKIAFPTRPVPAAELTERLNGRVQSSALNRAHETLASTISRVNHFRFPAIEGIFFDLP
jgi:hypothetical protein